VGRKQADAEAAQQRGALRRRGQPDRRTELSPQLGLLRGNREQQAGQVLDALLACIRRFLDPHRVRHMPCEWNAPLLRLVGDREKHLARQRAVDLDEVVAVLLGALHRLPAVVRRVRRDRVAPEGLRPIHDDAGKDHPGPGQRSFRQLPAPLEVDRVARHHADAGDTVRGEERQVRRRHERIAWSPVGMHVPQAGDQELAGAFDDLRLVGNRHFAAAADGGDAFSVDQHRHVRS
jgi:hypothetical protein